MDIKSPDGVRYLLNPDQKELQTKTLDRLLPLFFRENTITADSPIAARVASLDEPNEIEFHPLKDDATVTPKGGFDSPWRSSLGSKIVSTKINGVKFTVYYDNSYLRRGFKNSA